MKLLNRSFFARPTLIVAKDLIGKKLIRTIGSETIVAIITETEAYGHTEDPASHAYRGKTERTKALFGPVGHAYVYFIYGCHFSLNLVARDPKVSDAGGVLIRAVETDAFPHNRTNGPGKVAKALQIDRSLYGIDVTKHGPLYVVDGDLLPVECTPRIGISKATDKLWRCVHKKPSHKKTKKT